MKEEVEIQISPELIQQRLRAILEKGGEPNAELVSLMIVDNLVTTDMGISQLVYAFLGIEEKLPWLVGDIVMVDASKIHSWDCEKDEMIKKGYSIHKGHFVGKIKEIDMRKRHSITFEFDGLYKPSSGIIEERKCNTRLSPSSLKFPKDLPDNFEEKRENVASII